MQRGIKFTTFTLILLIFIISFSSASIQNLPPSKQNTCINITQGCLTCSFNTLTSIQYPDKSYAFQGAVNMTRDGTNYYYEFCNTSQIGTYIIDGYGDLNGIDQGWGGMTMEVTQTGTLLTSSIGIIYLLFLIGLLFLFLLTLYGAIKIRWVPDRSQDGKIINIQKLRYFKPLLITFAYIELWWIMGILYSISNNFLPFDNVSGIFNWAYNIMLAGVIPISFCALLFSLVVFLQDRNLLKKLKRGYNR